MPGLNLSIHRLITDIRVESAGVTPDSRWNPPSTGLDRSKRARTAQRASWGPWCREHAITVLPVSAMEARHRMQTVRICVMRATIRSLSSVLLSDSGSWVVPGPASSMSGSGRQSFGHSPRSPKPPRCVLGGFDLGCFRPLQHASHHRHANSVSLLGARMVGGPDSRTRFSAAVVVCRRRLSDARARTGSEEASRSNAGRTAAGRGAGTALLGSAVFAVVGGVYYAFRSKPPAGARVGWGDAWSGAYVCICMWCIYAYVCINTHKHTHTCVCVHIYIVCVYMYV